MNKRYLILIWILIFSTAAAQKNNFRIPDSLKHRNYQYLDSRIYDLRKDSLQASIYLKTYLYKAKAEKNYKEIINAYQNLLHVSPPSNRLVYADSMVYIAKKSKNDELIGSSFLTKGSVYYSLRMQQLAMDNYLAANAYISQTNNQYLIHKVKYCIALTKFYIGFYDESISLLNECIVYYKETQARPYLNSMHLLGLCYNKLGNYGKCSEINGMGISESQRLKVEEMVPYFVHSEGVNEYFKKNYADAIKNIESSLETIKENSDFANEEIAYFYIGKSYLAQHKKEKALAYFKLVDKIFIEKKILRPDLRQTYELLIDYYKVKNDLNRQTYYINQLLKADTLLNESSKYIIGKIHKQYDTKELLLEKERIAAENESMSEKLVSEKTYDIIFAGVILLLFSIIAAVTYYHKRSKRNDIIRYQLLMEEYDTKTKAKKIKLHQNPIAAISAETVELLLKALEKFEKERRFLESDWSLTTLSAAFKTNPKYLAIILEQYREKRITNYINGLRIEYIITLLRTESKFRFYTYEALAQEAGFSSTERFTNAFKTKTQITPQFFIEEIKKEKQ